MLLVGGFNPSEKYLSVGMILPNIWKNKVHVPNHQPATCPEFQLPNQPS